MTELVCSAVAAAPIPVIGLMGCVLVVDDDPEFRAMVRILLDPWHFKLLEACDGKQCIALLRDQPVDAVLMDIVMPEQDGIATLAHLKQQFPEILVVMVSGVERSPLYLSLAGQLGSDAVLHKSQICSVGKLLTEMLFD
jgi:CheY-like chemotaxis protein